MVSCLVPVVSDRLPSCNGIFFRSKFQASQRARFNGSNGDLKQRTDDFTQENGDLNLEKVDFMGIFRWLMYIYVS